HPGILLLPEADPVGAPLATYMGDVVLDLEITPNMARCLSVLGVAREAAALTGGKVRSPSSRTQADGAPIEGRVTTPAPDPAVGARYSATLISGVRIGPSPEGLRRRLRLAGIRPI